MKRITLIGLVLLAGLTLAVSAQGFRGSRMTGPATAAEEVTYTGRIRLVEGNLPVLVVGNEEYTLQINPALAQEAEITSNANARVSGFLREFRSSDLLSEERILHVRTIEVGGTRYVSAMGPGAMGPGAIGHGAMAEMHGRSGMDYRRGPAQQQESPTGRRGGRW